MCAPRSRATCEQLVLRGEHLQRLLPMAASQLHGAVETAADAARLAEPLAADRSETHQRELARAFARAAPSDGTDRTQNLGARWRLHGRSALRGSEAYK